MMGKIEADPVATVEIEEPALITDLSIEDFSQVPQSAAMRVDPFEGYPMKNIKLGERRTTGNKVVDVTTKRTYIVALAPSFYVPQDPSGLNQEIEKRITGQKKEVIRVDIKTSHNRCVPNSNGQNEDIVFDAILKMESGELRYAIVKDHVARSQLVYRINPKKEGRPIEVDSRYLLLDKGQVSRLKTVFSSVYYQQTKTEKAAIKHYEAKGDEEG